MAKFSFGDTVLVDDDVEGIVLMLTGSTVTVAFHKPSEFDAGRFSYYTEVYEIDRVEIA